MGLKDFVGPEGKFVMLKYYLWNGMAEIIRPICLVSWNSWSLVISDGNNDLIYKIIFEYLPYIGQISMPNMWLKFFL